MDSIIALGNEKHLYRLRIDWGRAKSLRGGAEMGSRAAAELFPNPLGLPKCPLFRVFGRSK